MLSKEILQQIANDDRRPPAERIAALSELVQPCGTNEAFHKQLEDLLAGTCVLAPDARYGRSSCNDGVPEVEVDPVVRQAYRDLTLVNLERLCGSLKPYDYRAYFERLIRLRSETHSDLVRAKAEEAMTYYLTEYDPELRTLAVEMFGDIVRKVDNSAREEAS